MAKTIRVYKSQNGYWVIKRDGATKAAGRFDTQKEAYLEAREIAMNRGLTITVYYPNGGIKAVINPKNRGEEESNCFITTSCVKYFGLKDNCYELQTLRKFRDNYLSKSIAGKELINQYYRFAPELVKKLEVAPDRKQLYNLIYERIQESCRAIENREFEKAKEIYKEAVSRLNIHFNNA